LIKTKETRWSLLKASPIYTDKGTIEYAVNVISDTTAQKRFEASLKFAAEASKVISSSLDRESILQQLTDLAVLEFADWCAVDIVEDGKITLKALANKDVKKIKLARNIRLFYRPDLYDRCGIGKVIATGKIKHYRNFELKKLEKIESKKLRSMLKRIGFTSIIIVPVIIKRKVIGSITFATERYKHKFSKHDLQIAQQLALQLAASLENAQLYEDVNNEKKRLDNLVSNVPGVVWETYPSPDKGEQKISFVNSYVEKLLGYSTKKWLGTNFWINIVHPEDRKKVVREVSEIFKIGKGVIRFRWIAKDKKVLSVEAQSQVIVDGSGKPLGMRWVATDITEREEMERRKDEFVNIVSHELRTPLTSLNIYSKILQDTLNPEEKEKSNIYFENMIKQVKRLNKLVKQILNVSSVSTGSIKLNSNYFSLDKLIRNNIDGNKRLNDRKIVMKGKTSKKVWGDKDYVCQVVDNLLENAVKYSPRSSEIVVKLRSGADSAVVSVKDHGFGIAKQYHKTVFERFGRVYDQVDRTYPGLGMGLYISREIIKKHGGNMWLKSESGKGSTFYFSIPYNKIN
jgi:PAS domain S-box-containing protein